MFQLHIFFTLNNNGMIYTKHIIYIYEYICSYCTTANFAGSHSAKLSYIVSTSIKSQTRGRQYIQVPNYL